MSPYEFLAQVLSEKYDVSSDAISPEATLTELGLDSLTVVELLFDVEDEFGIGQAEITPYENPDGGDELGELVNENPEDCD